MWKGTTPSLKPMPATTNATPRPSTQTLGESLFAIAEAIWLRYMVPVAP